MLVSKSFSQSDQIVSSLHIDHKEGEFKCFNIYFLISRRNKNRTILLQARARGYLARKRHLELLRNSKAVIIQSHVRGWLQQKKYRKTLRQVSTAKRSPSSLTEESKAGVLAPGKPFQPNVKATFVRN
jgi:IQ calmodulin-binding motif